MHVHISRRNCSLCSEKESQTCYTNKLSDCVSIKAELFTLTVCLTNTHTHSKPGSRWKIKFTKTSRTSSKLRTKHAVSNHHSPLDTFFMTNESQVALLRHFYLTLNYSCNSSLAVTYNQNVKIY